MQSRTETSLTAVTVCICIATSSIIFNMAPGIPAPEIINLLDELLYTLNELRHHVSISHEAMYSSFISGQPIDELNRKIDEYCELSSMMTEMETAILYQIGETTPNWLLIASTRKHRPLSGPPTHAKSYDLLICVWDLYVCRAVLNPDT